MKKLKEYAEEIDHEESVKCAKTNDFFPTLSNECVYSVSLQGQQLIMMSK